MGEHWVADRKREKAFESTPIPASSTLGDNKTNLLDRSSKRLTAFPPKRRRRGPRRVLSSSPSRNSTSAEREEDYHERRSHDIEIQETQEQHPVHPEVHPETHPPPLTTLSQRDEHIYIPSNACLSQTTLNSSYYIASSKEADNDSAIDLGSPIRKTSPDINTNHTQNPSINSVQVPHSDFAEGITDQINLRSSPSAEHHSTRVHTPESALFYPDFQSRAQSPDLASDTDHHFEQLLSSQDLPSRLASNLPTGKSHRPSTSANSFESFQTQVPVVSQSQPRSRLYQVEPSFTQTSSGQHLVRNSSPVKDVSLPSVSNSPAWRMAETSGQPAEEPSHSTSSTRAVPMSLREKIALARAGSKALVGQNIIKNSGPMSSSPFVRTPESPLAPQPIVIASSDTAQSSDCSSAQSDDVLPTTELPLSLPVETVVPSTDRTGQNIQADTPSSTSTLPKVQRSLFRIPVSERLTYALILPAVGHMRHRYSEWFREKDLRLLGKFLRKVDFDSSDVNDQSSLTEKVIHFVDQLKMATVHPDFNIDPRVYESMTQTVPEPSQEVQWADMSSTKFSFIGKLIEEIRMESRQIAIVAKTGQSIDTLETYMKGKRARSFRIQDLEVTQQYDSDDACQFILIGSDVRPYQTPKMAKFEPELVIDLDDSTRSNNAFVKTLTPSTPIIHLIVANSPEHIEKSVSQELSPHEQLRFLVVAATHLRKQMGIVPKKDARLIEEHTQSTFQSIADMPEGKECESHIAATVRIVAQALRTNNLFQSSMSLPQPILVGLKNTRALLERSEEPRLNSVSRSRTGAPSGLKRVRDQPSIPSTSKRLRTTPLQDVTHIGGSSQEPLSHIEDLRSTLKTYKKALDLERNEKAKFQKALHAEGIYREELAASLSSLQHRYETRTKDFHRLRHENTLLENSKITSDNKRDRILAENASLREEHRQLRESLAEARLARKEGGGPLADLERLREANEKLQKERDSLLKSNDNTKKDFEFTRQQYQLASGTAADLASQLLEKEALIAKLTTQASDERRRLRELNMNEHEKQHQLAVVKLEDELAGLTKLLVRKEDELDRARRGRGVQTRAGSAQPQPSSPRLVSRSGDSRGTSPIPGSIGEARIGHVHGTVGVSGGRTSALRREG